MSWRGKTVGVLYSGKGDRHKLIGNAVPPTVVENIALVLSRRGVV